MKRKRRVRRCQKEDSCAQMHRSEDSWPKLKRSEEKVYLRCSVVGENNNILIKNEQNRNKEITLLNEREMFPRENKTRVTIHDIKTKVKRKDGIPDGSV